MSIKQENKQTYVKIDFPTESARDLAAKHLLEKNIPCKGSINNTSNDAMNRKNEIIIRDIPIDYTENDVKRQFLIYGNILKVIIKVSGTWKQAHVFFEDAKTVEDNFINNWSDFIGKDGVRIYLADNYENNMNQRSQFCGKLCNLPKNTTAYDLEGYIRSVNGKTCFIPRARKTYNRLRYAYVNFESQEDLEKVLNNTVPSYIKNFQIRWVEPETKTCHICQSNTHLAASCPRIQQQKRNKRKIMGLAELYKKKKLPEPSAKQIINRAASISQKKSYAQTAKDADTNYNKPDKSVNDRLTILENMLETVIFTVKNMLDKCAEKEERDQFKRDIITRSRGDKTPTPAQKSKSKSHQGLSESIHNPLNSATQDNSLTVATESRMRSMETNIMKLVQTCELLSQKLTNLETPNNNTMQQ